MGDTINVRLPPIVTAITEWTKSASFHLSHPVPYTLLDVR